MYVCMYVCMYVSIYLSIYLVNILLLAVFITGFKVFSNFLKCLFSFLTNRKPSDGWQSDRLPSSY